MANEESYFWDMDHTLVNNDCDVSWKEFLIAEGLAPESDRQLAEKYYRDYVNNCLDDEEFTQFQLREFKGLNEVQVRELCLRHFEQFVLPKIYPLGLALVRQQIAMGKMLCLITATNAWIAEPLAQYFGFKHLRGSELEIVDGVFTGRPAGIYCLGEGKITVIKNFFAEHGGDFETAHYYGDSNADVPVMQAVAHRHCINPAPKLLAAAEESGWDVIKFSL